MFSRETRLLTQTTTAAHITPLFCQLHSTGRTWLDLGDIAYRQGAGYFHVAAEAYRGALQRAGDLFPPGQQVGSRHKLLRNNYKYAQHFLVEPQPAASGMKLVTGAPLLITTRVAPWRPSLSRSQSSIVSPSAAAAAGISLVLSPVSSSYCTRVTSGATDTGSVPLLRLHPVPTFDLSNFELEPGACIPTSVNRLP